MPSPLEMPRIPAAGMLDKFPAFPSYPAKFAENWPASTANHGEHRASCAYGTDPSEIP